MPGTAENAAAALDMLRNNVDDFILSDGGSTRITYLIDGVVYKVQWADADIDNLTEFDKINRMREHLPEGIFYPEVSLFNVNDIPVIAMDFIEGALKAECFCMKDERCTDWCMDNDMLVKLQPWLTDTSGLNVIVNAIGMFIIDAAF